VSSLAQPSARFVCRSCGGGHNAQDTSFPTAVPRAAFVRAQVGMLVVPSSYGVRQNLEWPAVILAVVITLLGGWLPLDSGLSV
jgi:hypothetical protein